MDEAQKAIEESRKWREEHEGPYVDYRLDNAEHLVDHALGPVESTAVIRIEPGKSPDVVKLLNEVMIIKEYADKRVITGPEDVKDATNDLSSIAKLKKAVEEKRKEYVGPLNEHIKKINDTFKFLSEPLGQADQVTRHKVLAYNAEIERQRQEIEEVNRLAQEVARKQAELNNGEFTVDTTPVEAPAATPQRVRADEGMTSKMTIKKWELIDITLVPADLLMVDAAKITKLVKAGIGEIRGIRIWDEPTLRVTTK